MDGYLTRLEAEWRAESLDSSRRVWATQTGRQFMAQLPWPVRLRLRWHRMVNRAGTWMCGHHLWRVAAKLWGIRV